ncbi:hypothetical protein B0O80DRAFT_276487 [Mortierella sp. GBAus27b]|nr:hypothetical protein BGX31_007609 [Mortierella sp. GBA43]KAI8358222.1 hypothetical protein B0O80DRAFT_276487 [Mortierella sp. GBAus27b]
MLHALSRSSLSLASLAQRQTNTRLQAAGALSTSFHSSTCSRNNNQFSEILNSIRSNSSTTGSSANTSSSVGGGSAGGHTRISSSLLGSSRNGYLGAGSNRNELPSLMGFSSQKANTTSNPIHLDVTHPTEGRSFRVNSAAAIDFTYRKLRVALNQSNIKRELRLKRTYESGHVKMRREHQERNKKLFGAMVRKKIELIKLMKRRGM